MDVRCYDEVKAAVGLALERYGRVDILHNSAGGCSSRVLGRSECFHELPIEVIDWGLDVNLKGPCRLTSVVGTRMAAGEGGSIIMVSSTASQHPGANVIPYAAAKAGVNAMTVGFARHFAPKVRVNCIVPGPFLTDISKAWDMDDFNERAATTIPLQRGGEPPEIVGAALYFASNASSYTTGALLTVAGGSGI